MLLYFYESTNFKRLNCLYLKYPQNDHKKFLSTIFLYTKKGENNFTIDVFLGTWKKKKNKKRDHDLNNAIPSCGCFTVYLESRY